MGRHRGGLTPLLRRRFALPTNVMSFGRPANAADGLAPVLGVIYGCHR